MDYSHLYSHYGTKFEMSALKAALIGRRVRVRWEGDDAWYTGVVTSYSSRRGHCVQFDPLPGEDDLTHWYENIDEQDWELLDKGKAKAQAQAQAEPVPKELIDGEEWLLSGEYVGRRVRRFCDSSHTDGKITRWIPEGKSADEPALWHMAHDDGDEEDLEAWEVRAAIGAKKRGLTRAPC